MWDFVSGGATWEPAAERTPSFGEDSGVASVVGINSGWPSVSSTQGWWCKPCCLCHSRHEIAFLVLGQVWFQCCFCQGWPQNESQAFPRDFAYYLNKSLFCFNLMEGFTWLCLRPLTNKRVLNLCDRILNMIVPVPLQFLQKILKKEESIIGAHLKGRYWTTSAWPPKSPPIWFCQHLLKSPFPSCERVEVEPLGEMNSFRERYLSSTDLSLREKAFQGIITWSLWSCVCYRARAMVGKLISQQNQILTV